MRKHLKGRDHDGTDSRLLASMVITAKCTHPESQNASKGFHRLILPHPTASVHHHRPLSSSFTVLHHEQRAIPMRDRGVQWCLHTQVDMRRHMNDMHSDVFRFVCSKAGFPHCLFKSHRKDRYEEHKASHHDSIFESCSRAKRRKPTTRRKVPVQASPTCVPMPTSTEHSIAYSETNAQQPFARLERTQPSSTAEYPVFGGEFDARQTFTGAGILTQREDDRTVTSWMAHQMSIDSQPLPYSFDDFGQLPLPNASTYDCTPTASLDPEFSTPSLRDWDGRHTNQEAHASSGWLHPFTWETLPMAAVPADSLKYEAINYSGIALFNPAPL